MERLDTSRSGDSKGSRSGTDSSYMDSSEDQIHSYREHTLLDKSDNTDGGLNSLRGSKDKESGLVKLFRKTF